jgi:mono/diheme cytochrome c family protein
MRRLAIVLLLALTLAACAEAAPTPRPTEVVPTIAPEPTFDPAGDVRHGAVLFTTWRCDNCHGGLAEGRIGPPLAQTRLSPVDFTEAIRETRPPKPAFSESELSEADVRDLYAWVVSLDAGVQAAAAPVLGEGEILGMQLYTESGCDRCHGAFAQGGSAAALVGYPEDAAAFLLAMSSSAADVPEHDLEALDAGLMRRLHGWLQAGADPNSGC